MHGIEIRRITLFVFGGAAQMDDEPGDWHGELQTAIIGPVVSLVLAGICIVLTGAAVSPLQIDAEHFKETLSGFGVFATLALWVAQINLMLGLFNLLPAFPLDGGRALRAILWGLTRDVRRATRWAAGLGQVFAWMLIMLGAAMMMGARVPVFGTGLISGLWVGLIGWFLNSAAAASYWQLVLKESLQHVAVSRLMETRFQSVAPDLPLEALVDDYLLHSDQKDFPVIDDGRFVGMVSLQQVRKVQRKRWRMTTAGEVMAPFDTDVQLAPHDITQKAMSLFGRNGATPVPVMEHGLLCGLVRREDILKWIALYEDMEMQSLALLEKNR
jgi:Zn-dependent protease/CBS domain-containing protein